jgi:hypothetical protein
MSPLVFFSGAFIVSRLLVSAVNKRKRRVMPGHKEFEKSKVRTSA